MIAIIDYGAGNLKSVKKAFDYLNVPNKIISSVEDLRYIEKIVLPGVGAFGAAVKNLQQTGFYNSLIDWLQRNRPFLGICLGMQLLLESSEESENFQGLGFLQGGNRRFQHNKVPQIGWNQINIKKSSKLFDGIENNSFFYLLHSYYVDPADEGIISATTEYGIEYPTVIEKGNVYAVQFHPEKSGILGLTLLKNWVEKC